MLHQENAFRVLAYSMQNTSSPAMQPGLLLTSLPPHLPEVSSWATQLGVAAMWALKEGRMVQCPQDPPQPDKCSEPLPAHGSHGPLPSTLQSPDFFPPSSPKEFPAPTFPNTHTHTHISENSLMKQKRCDSGVRKT